MISGLNDRATIACMIEQLGKGGHGVPPPLANMRHVQPIAEQIGVTLQVKWDQPYLRS